jgi:hypothetical protein
MRARAVRLRAACGVLVQRSPTSCGACRRRRHHIPRRPRRPDMPLPILSPIGLLLLAHMHVPTAAAWTLSAL